MKLIVGLGNPGPRYETTRHNAGFLAIDRLIDRWSASGPQSAPKTEVFTATVDGEKCLLAKPKTFMNLSGQSVGPLLKFYKLEPTDLIVIHDEVDLPPMALRLKTGGGTGGHNGLKSIDEALGGANGYHRVRVGVGKPSMLTDPGLRQMDTADYVLGQFTDQELELLDPLLDDVGGAIELMIKGEMSLAMTRFHRNPVATAAAGEKK